MAIWATVPLGDVLTFQRGFDITKDEQRDGPFPVISSSGSKSSHAEFKVRGPGVIIGRKGSLGTVFYSDGNYWPHDTTLWIKDFHGNHPRFAYYFLQTMGFERLDAGASNPSLNRNHIHTIPVLWPLLPVQQRIAGILSAYDELIENSQRRIRILEAMARALYREWFVHFRFPGHEHHPRIASPLGEIPQGWEAIAFTEIADVLSGGTPKTSTPEYWDGEIPFFTPRDAPDCFYVEDADKHVTELGLSKCASQLYPPDTVFITARGTVGKVALPSVPMAMNQSCYALRGKSGISQRFLFLMTLQQVEYLKTNTGGATFDTIVVDTFRRMQVAKPPHDLIAAFTRNVDAVFEQVNTLQCQVRTLRRSRDLLLPRLISGQIEVGAADDPAFAIRE